MRFGGSPGDLHASTAPIEHSLKSFAFDQAAGQSYAYKLTWLP
jgi:hypothetical protein